MLSREHTVIDLSFCLSVSCWKHYQKTYYKRLLVYHFTLCRLRQIHDYALICHQLITLFSYLQILKYMYNKMYWASTPSDDLRLILWIRKKSFHLNCSWKMIWLMRGIWYWVSILSLRKSRNCLILQDSSGKFFYLDWPTTFIWLILSS